MSNQSSQPLDYVGPQPPRPPRTWRRWFGWFIFGALCIALLLLMDSNRQPVGIGEVTNQIKADNVKTLLIDGVQVKGEFRRPVRIVGAKERVTRFRAEIPADSGTAMLLQFLQSSATIDITVENNLLMTVLVPLIPWLLIFGFIWFFVFRQLRKQHGSQPAPMRVVLVHPDGQPVNLPTTPEHGST